MMLLHLREDTRALCGACEKNPKISVDVTVLEIVYGRLLLSLFC